MRRWVFVVTVLLLSTPTTGVNGAFAQSRDEQAIRAVIDRVVKANNSVDVNVVKQMWGEYSSAGGPYYSPFGAPLASVSEMEKFWSQLLPQVSARTFATTSPANIRVDKNLAWANYTWRGEVIFKDGTRRSLEGRSTLTFAREGKGWKIVHAHSSLPAPTPMTDAAREAEVEQILQTERNAWEAIKNKQAAALGDYFTDDASIFEEGQAYRVSGKAQILSGLQAWLQQAELRSYQMLDPQVQALGNTALLTYYFTDSGVSGGKEFSTAGKISIVFVKQGNAWRAVHEHRSVNR